MKEPTRFSVIRYVPDPVIGEAINIGLVAIGQGQIAVRFLESWKRVECFAAGADVRFLQAFAREFEGVSPAQLGIRDLGLPESLIVADLERYARRWAHSIQFAEPSVSLATPEELVDELAERFLKEAPAARDGVSAGGRPRGRRTAAKIAYEAVSLAIQVHDLHLPITRKTVVEGVVGGSEFDVVAANGVPVLAGHGISFETTNEGELERSIDALGHKLWNVRQAHPDLALGVVALRAPCAASDDLVKHAYKVFEYHRATVTSSESDAQSWALEAAARYSEGNLVNPAPALPGLHRA